MKCNHSVEAVADSGDMRPQAENRGAVAGRGMGRGYPPASRLGGLGERRKLPHWGPGRSPDRKRILVHFELEKTNDKFDIFVIL